MNEYQNLAGLLKEDESLMTTTVQYGDNVETERLRIVVQELKNEIKSLSQNFKVKFDIIKRENTYKDEQIKLLQAEVDAKIAALNNHSVRGDGQNKIWAKMAELDDIIYNPKKTIRVYTGHQ